jgi:Right handed beta helix region
MTDIRVTSNATLKTALTAAKAGDRILLAAGNYGDVAIKGLNFASDITIMSASATNAAKINILSVTDSSHIKFQGLEIGRPLLTGEPEWTRYASVKNGTNITFNSVYFHGSLDGNSANDGQGLNVTASKFVTIQNSRFEQLTRGVVFADSSDLTLKGNSFRNLRSDGADFAAVQRVTIDANTFRDFKPVGLDHPDAIQFWTSGTTKASTDILISNNQIFQGNGGGIQAIFLRDEVGTLPYQNVRITNNVAYVPDFHNGIALLGGRNVEISGNTVLSPTTDTKKFTIRLENTAGAVIRNNVADVLINVNNTALTLGTNKFLSTDPKVALLIPDVNKGALATAAGLVISGTGYVSGVAGSTLVGEGTALTTTATKTTASFSTVTASDSIAPATLADTSATTAATSSLALKIEASPTAPASAFAAAAQPSAFSASPIVLPSAFASLKSFAAFRFGDLAAG